MVKRAEGRRLWFEGPSQRQNPLNKEFSALTITAEACFSSPTFWPPLVCAATKQMILPRNKQLARTQIETVTTDAKDGGGVYVCRYFSLYVVLSRFYHRTLPTGPNLYIFYSVWLSFTMRAPRDPCRGHPQRRDNFRKTCGVNKR